MRLSLLLTAFSCGMLAACGDVTSTPIDAGIDAPPAGPTTITYTSQLGDGQPANTNLVAFQDGEGPWQVVTGTAGVYTFSVSAKRYGLLAACERSLTGSTFVVINYAAVTDPTARFGLDFCLGGSPTAVTITGTAVGVPTGQQLWVSSGFSASLGPPGNWTISTLAGAGTLVAMAMDAQQRPTSMIVRKATYTANAAFALDFAGGFFPSESQLTLDPTGTAPSMTTSYLDEEGGMHQIDLASTAVTSYRVVPPDRIGNGISILSASSFAAGVSRSLQRAFKSPVAQTTTLPAAFLLAAAPLVVATTPYPIVEAVLPRRTGASHYSVRLISSIGRLVFHSWELTASAAWVESAPGGDVTVRTPDFSTLAGWKPAFALVANNINWAATVGSGPPRLAPGASRFVSQGRTVAHLADGEEASTSISSGSISPFAN
jgi:hypothetical protein